MAKTRQPRAFMPSAQQRPMPVEQPVIRIVRAISPGVRARAPLSAPPGLRQLGGARAEFPSRATSRASHQRRRGSGGGGSRCGSGSPSRTWSRRCTDVAGLKVQSADHVGDALEGIVDDDGEVVAGRCLLAGQDDIAPCGWIGDVRHGVAPRGGDRALAKRARGWLAVLGACPAAVNRAGRLLSPRCGVRSANRVRRPDRAAHRPGRAARAGR